MTIDYMFETIDATVLYGECASSNRASVRVMEKVGMTLVDQWSEINPVTGQTEIQVRYALERNKRGELNDQYHLEANQR